MPNLYQYNGKEQQDELGLNWLDFGARMYMGDIGRWGLVDPLSDERHWVSPYQYVQNNPINRNDPDGMLDDYVLNENGQVSLLKKTDDKFDRLYAVDDEGQKKDIGGDGKASNDFVQVSDKTILPQLAAEPVEIDHDKVNVAVTESGSDVKNVFKFASDNSKVEWRAVSFTEGDKAKFAVGTDHTSDYSPSLLQMGIAEDKATYSIHSHPSSGTKAIEERRSMGYDWGGNRAYGDWAIIRKMADPNTKKLPYPYKVYLPNSGNIYNLGYNAPTLQGKFK